MKLRCLGYDGVERIVEYGIWCPEEEALAHDHFLKCPLCFQLFHMVGWYRSKRGTA